ncbi:GtrA family protein [Fusobacterium polymorphum]
MVDFIIYSYLLTFFSINISKLISMLSSSLFSYFMNKIFTFNKGKNYNSKYLLKYYIVFLINLLTNISVNYYICKWTSIKILAFILATLFGMIVNFIGQKFYVFK